MEIVFRQRGLLQMITRARRSREGLFSLLAMGQTPRTHAFLVRVVSQCLSEAVDTIFGEVALLVPVTEPARRQVWFAALALLQTDGRLFWFKRDQVKRDELIAVLLSASNERILKTIRPEGPPRHYLSAITKLGDSARNASTYAMLWKWMKRFPGAARTLAQRAHAGTLTDSLIYIVSALQPSSEASLRDALRAADRFEDREAFESFLRLYEPLMQRRGVEHDDVKALAMGVAPHVITDSLLKRIAFPNPVLNEPFRYANNWLELKDLGDFYQNCLRSRGWVERARGGTVQIYQLKEEGTDIVLALIREDTGWRLSEAKLVGNRALPRALRERLISMLLAQGVHTGSCADVVLN
jgi:hypothetical protein